MPLWEIEAVVSPDDPRWLGRRVWRSVLVRASSAAAARVVAGSLENTHTVGNESDVRRTGFSDEKLYWVKQVTDAREEEAGPDSVLAASPYPRH